MRRRMGLSILNTPSKVAHRVKPLRGTMRQVTKLTGDLFCGDNERLVIQVYCT